MDESELTFMRRRRAGKTVAQLWIILARLTKTRAAQSVQVVQVKHSISPASQRALLLHNISLFSKCAGHIKCLSIHADNADRTRLLSEAPPSSEHEAPTTETPASLDGPATHEAKGNEDCPSHVHCDAEDEGGPNGQGTFNMGRREDKQSAGAIADMQHCADCRNVSTLHPGGAGLLLPIVSTAFCSPDQQLHDTNMNTTIKAAPGSPVGQPQHQPIHPDTSAMAGPAQCQEGHACIPNDSPTGHKVPADVHRAEGHAACISRGTAGLRMAGSQALSHQKVLLPRQPAAPSSHGEVAVCLPYIG